MNLSEADVRDLRRQGDLLTLMKQARAAGAAENKRRRALVLKYPDLAERLTQPPIRHTTPEHWTGYVPPAHDAYGIGGGQPINTSPVRAALVALVAEAEARAAGKTAEPESSAEAA